MPKWETMGKIVAGLFMQLLLTVMAGFMFFSEPTGHFYMNNNQIGAGACTIYEEVQFGPDRRVYTGDADRAYQLYMQLRQPPVQNL